MKQISKHNTLEVFYSLPLETICGLKFTQREIDVIACLISGRNSKTISSFLNISPRTAETHIRNIMHKLECNSQKSVIEFVENSEEFFVIKKHYEHLLLHTEFEECLLNIKKLVGKHKGSCNLFYQVENLTYFIQQIAQHLEDIGIKACSKVCKEGKSLFASSRTPDKEGTQYNIYTLSETILADLQANKEEKVQELNQLIHGAKASSSSLFFLLMPKTSTTPIPSIVKEVEHLNAADYSSYYFVFLELIKKLFPEEDFSNAIKNFKQSYERFHHTLEQTNFYSVKKPNNSNPIDITSVAFVAKLWRGRKNLLLLGITLLASIGVFFSLSAANNERKIERSSSSKQPEDHVSHLSNWNLPFPNLYFTGRQDESSKIASKFEEADNKSEAIALVVCAGLGGIGKTELAKNYIHNWHKYSSKRYTTRVWLDAEKLDQLLESYSALGQKLGITTVDTPAEVIIEKIKEWFETHPGWLIIYDNAENFDALVNFFPQKGGHILITSRHLSWPNVLEVDSLSEEDAINLTHKIINRNDNASEIKLLVQTLEKVPLAISQASAYILQNGKTIKDYLQEYSQEQYRLLADNSKLHGLHHSPIAITWNISIRRIKEESTIAYKLINTFVYLYPDNISRDHLIDLVPEVKEHPAQVDKAVQALISHSMVKFNSHNNSLSMHRLVQEVMWHQQFEDDSQSKWLGRVLDVLIQDRDDHFILGGHATRKETLKNIIRHYENLPSPKKTALLYHSLACCYLVKGNFEKAEVCFENGIEKEANSAICLEYGQALYLRKQFDKAIKYLKLSIQMSHDNFYSYFSEMEKDTIDPILQSEIDRIGVVRSKSFHLAYYLLLKIFLESNNKKEFNFYYYKFRDIAKNYNNTIITKLFNDISSRK